MKGVVDRHQEQEQFCASFSRLNWEMHKHSMERLEQIGLTMPQLVVLVKLDEHGGTATMCELVELTLQSGPTLTRIVDRMVASGFVDRERDDHDRRVVHIVLTDLGREKRQAAVALYVADIERLTSRLDDEELRQLNRLVSRLLGCMDTVRSCKDAAVAS